MRDFNTVMSDLILKLSLSCQKTDGEILWYEGTLDVLVEFLSILHQKAEEGGRMRYLKRGDPCPLCGQPIQTDSYEELELLSCIAWLMDNGRITGCAEDEEGDAHDADPD